MGRQTIQAIYAFVVGVGMISYWVMILASGNMPEFTTAPTQSLVHLTAEGLTALALLAGGYGLLSGRAWANRVYPFSLGMVLVAMANAVYYFYLMSEVVFIILFVVLILPALIILRIKIRRERHWALLVIYGGVMYYALNTSGAFAQGGNILMTGLLVITAVLMVLLMVCLNM